MPDPIEVIHTIEAFHPYQVEQHWQKRFADKHRNGEWFDLTDEDVVEFKRFDRM